MKLQQESSLHSRIIIFVLFFGVYSSVVVYLELEYLARIINIRSTAHSLLAIALGTLLVFRTNTAYDRWWEARKLWGQLVNDCRNLAIKIYACVRISEEEKQLFGEKLTAFCFALKDHLRGKSTLQSYKVFEKYTETPLHVPLFICRHLYQEIESWRVKRKLGSIELFFLDTHAASLMNICGACERIRNTPIAGSWRIFIRQIIIVYLLTLPWGLVEDLKVWTIPISILVGYFMIGMEAIAETIEEPFGLDKDDLKLDLFCSTIEKSIDEVMHAPGFSISNLNP